MLGVDMQQYRDFYESSPLAFWRTSIKDGQFLLGNLACARLLGFNTLEELMVEKATHFYLPGHREQLLKLCKKNGSVKDYEVLFVLKDGTKKWISITGQVHSDKDYFEGVLEDITSRKNLEEKISIQSEQIGELKKGIIRRLENLS